MESANVRKVEMEKSTSYIKKTTPGDDESVYKKISNAIEDALKQRPTDAVSTFQYLTKTIVDSEAVRKDKEQFGEKEMKLFDDTAEDDNNIEQRDDDYEIPVTDCFRLGHHFEQAAIGLGKEETYRIFLALKQLALECAFINVRFWGKMFGVQADYFIAETEYRDGEGDDNVEQTIENKDNERGVYDIEESPVEYDDLPKPNWKEPLEVKSEGHHFGANKNVFFACNALGEVWTRLPHVTPQSIKTSRRIRKLLTGNLEAEMKGYPPFQGTESVYLRALIARISASTHVSPTGFFMFNNLQDDDNDDDFEDDYEETNSSNLYLVNTEYDGVSKQLLSDGTMFNWVHHAQYLLPQGRCKWLDPLKEYRQYIGETLDEEEEEVTLPVETGPHLLLSAANDKHPDETSPAWSSYLSSLLLPKYAVAVARSNIWPGAYTFCDGKEFENIYIGWGQKYSSMCYNAEFPPPSYKEFENKQETTEMDDPTLEQENAFRELEQNAANSADEMDNAEEGDGE